MTRPPADDETADLHVTREELRVAEDELHRQNAALVEANAALSREQRRYRDLFETAPDAYVVTTAAGAIREANRAACDLFGVAPDHLRGRPIRLLFVAKHRPAVDRLLASPGVCQTCGLDEWLVQGRTRGPVPVAVSVQLAAAAEGRQEVRWLLHDVTALKVAQRRALDAERFATIGQTLATLAHEGRNALQRAQACLRMLALEVEDRPRAVDYVERMQAAQTALQLLFDDARSYSAPPLLRRERCDLAAVWRAAWTAATVGLPGPPAVLTEDAAGHDLELWADPTRLEQVFRNLFENALAVCPPGTPVAVRAAAAEAAAGVVVLVTVEDCGPGFADPGRAFEPFYTTKPGGTGLGLSIVRRIVDAHGGTIAAGNRPAGGAAVRLTLPREPPPPPRKSDHDPNRTADRRG